jgi:hypothetical protein
MTIQDYLYRMVRRSNRSSGTEKMRSAAKTAEVTGGQTGVDRGACRPRFKWIPHPHLSDRASAGASALF